MVNICKSDRCSWCLGFTKETDLAIFTLFAEYSTKMSKGENVTVETLGKICTALGCTMDDIVEIVADNKGSDYFPKTQRKRDISSSVSLPSIVSGCH